MTVALCHCLLTVVIVTHCTSKHKTFQGKIIMREVSCSRGLEGSCWVLSQKYYSRWNNVGKGNDRQPVQVPCCLWVQILWVAMDILIRMSLLLESEECKSYTYFFAPFTRLWCLGGQELLFIVLCLLLSTKSGTKDTFGESSRDGKMNAASSFKSFIFWLSLIPFLWHGSLLTAGVS